MLNSPTPLYR